MLAWLTKSALPNSLAEYVITLPTDELWQADFFGAIAPLVDAVNWEQHETLTPDEMADKWAEILLPQFWSLKLAIPVGTILTFAGADIPDGYVVCDGSSLLRSQYEALFDVIGTVYGAVDGTHFNVPNLLGRFILGDTVAHPAGQTGGSETHTLTVGEMPAHIHNYYFHGGGSVVSHGIPFTNIGQLTNGAIQSAGGGAAHNNMPPYLALFFIIKY